jgi:uncharacterized repeat protein (TIGR03803 family)
VPNKLSLRCISVLALVFLAAGFITIQAAEAQTFTLLYSFKGPPDGGNPYAGLIEDNHGNRYGTTYSGGMVNSKCFDGACGTVFKLDAAGKETVLHRFTDGKDGANPYGGLIRDAAGNLYGTTYTGGYIGVNQCSYGCGTVFKIKPSGQFIVLFSFHGSDGGYPLGGLLRDAAGTLYGTTSVGGAYDSGTIFKLDVRGKETVLYSFTGGADGAQPLAGLVQDVAGNLYGTAVLGGNICDGQGVGCGTVFKFDTKGHETTLHTFTGYPNDGKFPPSSLVWDKAGNLYGTTEIGGNGQYNCNYGCGTIFKLQTNGKEEVLYSFTGGADGGTPNASLLWDSTRREFYGTTVWGGAHGAGTVFRLDSKGKETVLHSFTGGSDGLYPSGNVTRDKANNLYGMTTGGVPDCGRPPYCGTVFKVSTK